MNMEDTYGRFLQISFAILNPFKKAVIRTQCQVHKHLNHQAINILNNDGYRKEANFFRSYIVSFNEGAVWADQDFKSSQHFYNPYTHKGMYGRKNARNLGLGYYTKSLRLWKLGEYEKSMFYLGAAIHIIQDMTIPQHANVRLLDNHRQYENFVKRTYQYIHDFKTTKGTVILYDYDDFITFNSKISLKVYKRFKNIADDEERFYRTTRCTLPLAVRTTAGSMAMFYQKVFNIAEKLN